MKNRVIKSIVASSLLFSVVSPVLADTTEDLINALIVKGVIGDELVARLSKKAEAENNNSGKVKFKKGGGFSIESGDGESNMKVAGRIQLDYRNFDSPQGTSANSKAADGFDIRRAYLGVAGTFNKNYGYKFTGSFGSSTKLDEGYLEFKHIKKAKLRMGQFKMPMSLEERTSSRFLNFTERSYVNNGSLTAGKEVGIMLHGTQERLTILDNINTVESVDMPDDSEYGIKIYEYELSHSDLDMESLDIDEKLSYSHQSDMAFSSSGSYQIKQQSLGKGQEFFKTALSATIIASIILLWFRVRFCRG